MKELYIIDRIEQYREKYDINIQLWDEVNVYVHAKEFYRTELTFVGGYYNLIEALNEVLLILDEWNGNNE